MNTYAPVFSSITESSLWREEDFICKAFITLIAIKDMNHIAHVNAFTLGQKCWPTNPDAEKIALKAIKVLLSPDTKRIEKQLFDGRRIEKVDDGYLILNGQHYEDMARTFGRRVYKAKKEREYQVQRKRGQPLPGETRAVAAEKNGASPEQVAQIATEHLPLVIGNGLRVVDEPISNEEATHLANMNPVPAGAVEQYGTGDENDPLNNDRDGGT